ncbi:MAG: type III pantothenate kinase [Candidatus Sumerlaeota bacterium]|nr:type III pantothenate kinase [Candidatus Sumerlaeota bacterium]
MLLAIDIGNTQTTLGLIEGDAVLRDWRLSTRPTRTSDELVLLMRGCLEMDGFKPDQIIAAVIGSVVTHLTPAYEQACQRLFGRPALTVTGLTSMPVKNGYSDPNEVGIDRLANAVAGVRRFGCPLVVVDFGTAITLDVISHEGVYLGGVILPSAEIMAETLSEKTSRLPHIAVEQPASAIGRTTRDSIASGLFFGTVGAVDALVERVCAEMSITPPHAVATGGRAPLYAKSCKTITACEPFLTLFGLKEIWEHQPK